jgi:predicted GNAT superfamily acetyltransferase
VAAGQAKSGLIEVRPLKGIPEYARAVDLQRRVWGFADLELLPVRLFVTGVKVGGQALGAFDGSKLVGFCLAIPGIQPGGKTYLHSHMLGVLKKYRDAGIGRMLKLAQREDALERGIDLVEWTFDPLEIKNAWFNIERLGAIVRRFVPNQYGNTTSPLHGGLPTDRCIAEWWIRSQRAVAAINGRAAERSEVRARIEVPADIETLKRTDTARARKIHSRVREQFLEHLSKGLAVIGLERTPGAGVYLLGPWESE